MNDDSAGNEAAAPKVVNQGTFLHPRRRYTFFCLFHTIHNYEIALKEVPQVLHLELPSPIGRESFNADMAGRGEGSAEEERLYGKFVDMLAMEPGHREL